MNIHILLVYYFVMHMLFRTIVCLWSFFVIIFLSVLCNFVIYCFDLKAYCISAVFMMNSTFSPTFADDGSVNVYVCGLKKLWKSFPAVFVIWTSDSNSKWIVNKWMCVTNIYLSLSLNSLERRLWNLEDRFKESDKRK